MPESLTVISAYTFNLKYMYIIKHGTLVIRPFLWLLLLCGGTGGLIESLELARQKVETYNHQYELNFLSDISKTFINTKTIFVFTPAPRKGPFETVPGRKNRFHFQILPENDF
jgi:hypothetical protein